MKHLSYLFVPSIHTQALRLYNFCHSNSTEHELIMLINVKMPTNVGILTFTNMINTTSESFKARNVCLFQHFIFISGGNC